MSKVLIAEDEVDLALLWRDALMYEGHDVVVVHDGKVAIDTLKAEKFDVIVVDFVMPEIGGLVVSGLAGALQDKPRIILVSGKLPNVGGFKPADMDGECGITRTLIKPVDLETLIDAVGSAKSPL